MLQKKSSSAHGAKSAPLGRRIGVAQRAAAALRTTLERRVGDHRFDEEGRLIDWSDALIGSLDKAAFAADQTLAADHAKFVAPESSAGLALNMFGPWRAIPGAFQLAGVGGFEAMRFNARCPTGVRGTPPILDFLAAGRGGVVAVAARCTEFIARRRAKVAKAYDALAPQQQLGAWFEALERTRCGEIQFRHVDLTALAKHALGLTRTFPKRDVVLVYLYWEPTNHERFAQFADHRQELEIIAPMVEDSAVRLEAMRVSDLADAWWIRQDPAWLRNHVAELKGRYHVAIPV